MHSKPLALSLVAFLSLGLPLARAADGTWNLTAGNTSGTAYSWDTASNWVDNGIADGSGFTATFTSGTTGAQHIQLDTDRTIGGLTFANHAWSLYGPGVLTLAGASTPGISASTQGTTLSAVIAGSQGFALSGGSLTLSGGNTFSGAVTVSTSGTALLLAHANALGNSAGVTINNGAALVLNNDVTISGKTLNLTGGGGTNSNGALRIANGTSAEWAGAIVLSGSNTRITAGAANSGSAALRISGVISGSGGLFTSGLGTLTLTKASTYTGGTQVYRGTLRLDEGNNRLPTGTVLTIGGTSDAATVDLNGYDQTVAALESGTNSGARTLTNTAETRSTFTVSQASGTRTFDGVISGDIAFVKSGAGTLNLTGTANTFSGDITINAGTLGIASAFISDTAAVSIADGATFTLAFSGTDTIGTLALGGVARQIGTYGALGSGAQFESAFFTGTGLLAVTVYAIPEPASLAALLGACTLAAVALRRRR